jgi:hypothetical protein
MLQVWHAFREAQRRRDDKMAVTDQTTVRELVRAVAEALRDEPVVRRLWVWTGPSKFLPDDLTAIWYIIVDSDDEAVREHVEHIVTEAQEPYQAEIGSVISTMTGVPPDVEDFPDWIPEDAVEVPLRPG